MNKKSMYAPIALFVYCRPEHTKRTVEAILNNKESKDTDLFVFSDAAKNKKALEGVQKTREYIHTISGFKSVTIVERERNWGLAKSLSTGITEIVNKYGRVIVIEDDIYIAPYCLKYFNDALKMYNDDVNVASIHAYTYPHREQLPETFFIKGADCWGWATWKRAWDVFSMDANQLKNSIINNKRVREFEFDYTYPYMGMLQSQIEHKISSWAICWYASAFLHNMYTLYPNISMAKQIGMDGIGATHSGVTNSYDVELNLQPLHFKKIQIEQSEIGESSFKKFFIANVLGKKGRLKRILKLMRDSLQIKR